MLVVTIFYNSNELLILVTYFYITVLTYKVHEHV
jgi:hypothetical protein